MKIIKLLVVLIVSLSIYVPVYADENIYEVYDTKSTFVDNFDSYDTAYDFYCDHLDDYENLILKENDNVIEMEYGIIEFVSEDDIINYYSLNRSKKDVISPKYGIDAVYLYRKQDNVYFEINGDFGYTSIDNVRLIPIDELRYSISSYSTKNNALYHNIKNQLKYENYVYSYAIDDMPSFMANNHTYYSYDGHYFYDDFKLMVDDIRNGEHISSINEEPYYNYYEFLPYHSLTNYQLSELENYFYNVLGINGRLIHYEDLNGDYAADEINRSQYYENVNEFFANEAIYGTNAMMLISSSIVDSAYGRNLNSYISNNIYTNAAYETLSQKENDSYDSVAQSITSYSKYYINKLYSNYLLDNYYGTNFGNKNSGINVEYSLDHYYGEKAASEYYKIDSKLGFKDKNAYAIAIIDDIDSLQLYKDETLETKFVEIDEPNDFVYIVLDEHEDSYKIQTDKYENSEYTYNFENSVAYISKENIKLILNKDKIHNYAFNDVKYDFNGGLYNDHSSLKLHYINDSEPFIKPNKQGYEFIDYSKDIDKNGVITYKANYRKIDSISINRLFISQKELLPIPDLQKAKLMVNYENGSYSLIPITSDMVSRYNLFSDEVQNVTVNYCGLTTSKDIQIDISYYDEKEKYIESIKNEDLSYIQYNIDNFSSNLGIDDIRNIDYELKQNNKRNYVIKDKTGNYDISVSGLDLSLDDRKNFNMIEDTYYFDVDKISGFSKNKIMQVSDGYGFDEVLGLNISFKFNYQKINLRGPIIVQIDIPNKKNDCIYSVYHLSDNGDVIKCKTTQTNNYIQFIAYEAGDYLALSMPTVNIYEINDQVENLSHDNMGFDNNRTNIEFMLGLSLIFISLIGILLYYRIFDLKEKEWKDYKKSLLKADTVQEEKLKN